MTPQVARTVLEAREILAKLPENARVEIYNDDAMQFTPVEFRYFEAGCPAELSNRVILDSSVVVQVEDYD